MIPFQTVVKEMKGYLQDGNIKSADELLMLEFDEDDLCSKYTTPDNIGQLGIIGYIG